MPDLSDATRGRLLFGGDYNPEQWPAAVTDRVTLGRYDVAVLRP